MDEVEDGSESQELKLLRNENNIKSDETQRKDAKWYLRKRYYIVLLTFWGQILVFALRMNFGIAIIEMTSDKSIIIGNQTYVQKAEFTWNSLQKGILLSSFSWGHFFAVIGGALAVKIGGTNVVGLGVAAVGVLTILTPLLIRIHILVFVVARACEGFAEICSTAALADIVFHWSPPNERVRFSTIAHSSHQFGPAISYPILGYILKRYGWEAMYFMTGGFTMLWVFVWWAFVSKSPHDDTIISNTEKNYLIKMKPAPDKKIKCHWKKILTSKAVWAYVNERFVESWSYSFVVICLPLFIKDMQDIKIDKVGLISSIPNFCSFVGLILSSFLADYIRNKNRWTISHIHKIFIAVAQSVCIGVLIIMIIWMDFKGTILCLAVFRFSFSLAVSCYTVLPVDMGGPHASVVKGLSSSFRGFGDLLNPIVMGLLVSNHTVTEWIRYFILLCTLNIWGMIIFCMFGSGELQPWAKSENDDDNRQ